MREVISTSKKNRPRTAGSAHPPPSRWDRMRRAQTGQHRLIVRDVHGDGVTRNVQQVTEIFDRYRRPIVLPKTSSPSLQPKLVSVSPKAFWIVRESSE